MREIIDQLKQVRAANQSLVTLSEAKRNQLLSSLSTALIASTQAIVQANKKDLAAMSPSDPKYDRLMLTPERIDDIARDVRKVVTLPTATGNILMQKTLDNGLRLEQVSVPLGVVGVIYESRPNVTVDVFSLCFKSGNACVLKGGKEAHHSNKVLVDIIKTVLDEQGLDSHILYLMPADRAATGVLLQAVGLVDICIPRGSQRLIDFVRDHAKIPTIETGAGVVHAYFHCSGDAEKGQRIIDNAKTRRVSVCNALDSLVIDQQRLTDLPYLVATLATKSVQIFADPLSYEVLQGHYPAKQLRPATEADFGQEYLDYRMSIKVVEGIEQAVDHIMQYTSGHSETIIAKQQTAIDYFMQHIDVAAVYANASTAFTDGGEFGMGAEIGISTQKLHARGPMALAALTSYQWRIFGDGHIRP